MKRQKLDAKDSIFFQRELEHTKARTYDTKFPEFKARSLIPVSSEADTGDESIKYDTFTEVGIAKIVANYAKDFPRADVKGEENVSIIKSLGASYGYSMQDIRAAAKANKPLKQSKANAARRTIFQLEEDIAWFGNAANNLGGFLTNANVPSSVLPADGAGGLTTLASKDPDKVLRDLNACANSIATATKGVEQPNTLLVPLSVWTFLTSTPRSSTSDTTIMEFFLKNNPFIDSVDWLNQLTEPVGGWGTKGLAFTGDVMVAYNRNVDKLSLEIPQDFEQFEEEKERMEFLVPVHERIGGVLIYYPLSMNICEGV